MYSIVRNRIAMVALATAAVGVGACADGRNPVQPTSSQSSQTLQSDPALGPELAAVRAATAQFHDVDVAVAAGYTSPVGRPCDVSAAGVMGIHSPNPALLGSQALDPTTPEVLLYMPKPEGGYRLIGVEYIQFVLLRDPSTGVVAPWTSPTPWPSTYQVVTPTPQLFGRTFDGPMPGHFPGMPWHWDLHVWVWSNNPSGVFAQWNSSPSVSCGT